MLQSSFDYTILVIACFAQNINPTFILQSEFFVKSSGSIPGMLILDSTVFIF